MYRELRVPARTDDVAACIISRQCIRVTKGACFMEIDKITDILRAL